jgi:hypothetical protein
MDEVVAIAANHEGFAAEPGHGLCPSGLRLAGLAEVSKRPDVVDLDVIRSLAELASAPEQPGDQLPAGVDGPGVLAVGEDRVLQPLERNAAGPCGQWCAALAPGAGLKSGAQPVRWHRSWPRRLRWCFHQAIAGLAPVSGVIPADVNFHLLETGIQAIKLSPCHAGPPEHHP